uniref:PA14 domain-containing protein n=1 Tax=Chitinophaga sancti TaxID=1004 RepID=UPI003F7A49CD
MILNRVAGSKRLIASMMLAILYMEMVLPAYAIGAPVRNGKYLPLPAHPPIPLTASKRAAVINPVPVINPGGVLNPASAIGARIALNPAAAINAGTAINPSGAFNPASAAARAPFIGGPTQPESQAFHSVNSDDMVDLFSGDFSYTIPLMDVGGYPVAIGYNSGSGMDEDASWVGLGWNLNPGAINRNLRGLPDDFNGTDTVQKVVAIKENKSIGTSIGLSEELIGLPTEKLFGSGVSVGVSAGITYNNYKGYGFEAGISPSINVGSSAMGSLTGGLSLTNSSMDGLSVGASLDYQMALKKDADNGPLIGSVGLGTGFNSRSGLSQLSLSVGARQYHTATTNNGKSNSYWSNSTHGGGTLMSFAYPSYLPSITLPYTNTNLTYSLKVGGEKKVDATTVSVSGYSSTQEIKPEDQHLALPAYGYLNYQGAGTNNRVLLDFNREKDIAYRETPAVPNIGIPSYTYDVWSVSGEGIGGSFRAYRGEVGHVFDHYNKTKYSALNVGVDLALGDLVHAGADVGLTYAYTETGPWSKDNTMANVTAFSKSHDSYEAAYFRNPSELTVNDKDYYKNLGDDDVIAVKLYQSDNSSSTIQATSTLSKYNNKKSTGDQPVSSRSSGKTVREKRTQVISYLTAEEANSAGFSKFIENYSENVFKASACPVTTITEDLNGDGTGLLGEFYTKTGFQTKLREKTDTSINFANRLQMNVGIKDSIFNTVFSARWTGKVKAPVTGTYTFYTESDDGIRLFLNDSVIIKRWNDHPSKTDSAKVNLIEGEYYDIKIEYYNNQADVVLKLQWAYPSQSRVTIPGKYLYYSPAKDSLAVDNVSHENRVNSFRMKNHISEIDVVNQDGRKYVYGIPVYNLQQKSTTFSVQAKNGNTATGLVKYTAGTENTVNNTSGNDHYFSSELTPAYAHTYLLSAVVSPDYQDLTGNGITADDPGDAIKFNYTRIAGINNPYSWRAPIGENQANYNEGLRTDSRDDKGSYIYGQKELWYLNSIESKDMIATFCISARTDLPAIDENGVRHYGAYGRKLDSIRLYTKAEFMKSNPKPLKVVHFEYSNELCPVTAGGTDGKLTLKKIWFTYNNNQKGKRHPYLFNYNANNPAYNSQSVDRWGNYKSSIQNPGQLNNNDYPYSLQDSAVAAQNAAVWALDSITIPSGGRIKIDYESDDYGYVQNKRAAQMCSIAGFSATEPGENTSLSADLYKTGKDYQYVVINVPKTVSSKAEAYTRYLEGMDKLFFRLYVKMPSDKWGSGYEYIPCYATIDSDNYGYYKNSSKIWVRIKAIDTYGKTDLATSIYSPLAKATISYLRLNLPSKAYPGSEVGDNVTAIDIIKMLASQADNVFNTLLTFDVLARVKGWAKTADVARSYVRLNNPYYKKYGGGLRVKRIKMYDHWDAMTKQRQSIYGQEYQYTTTRTVNGQEEKISSGVASYEPLIGGEENPWRQPIEYTEQVSVLAPVASGYTETPLGEEFFPAASIGYSKVRVRTINAKNIRSVNGFNETCFYTSYDFPTLTDMTLLADGKKRFKPKLANLLRINARHYLAVSQGFKVELNDMSGRVKSQGMYSETNSTSPITYTENYYRVDDQTATAKHLNNTVMAMTAKGVIDTTAVIGKDMEVMMDMREQHSVTTASNIQINGDLFTFAFPPVFLIPMLLSVYHREETLYHSAAVSKVIYRHGILDSVIAIDKGSKVISRNLMYDAETGNVILTSTQNEYGDPIYQFSMPAGWVYDGMSGAYKNINVELEHVYI